MTRRRWLGVIVGMLGIYFLLHAGILAFGAYAAGIPQHQPVGSGYGSRAQSAFQTWSMVFATFGVLSVISSVGILRIAKWAAPLWLATSAALVVLILFGTLVLNADWTHFVFELLVVSVSWWLLWTISRERLS